MSTKTVEVEPTSPARRRLGWIAALAIAASTAVLISYDTSAADPAPDAPAPQARPAAVRAGG